MSSRIAVSLQRRSLDLADLARAVVTRFVDEGGPGSGHELVLDAPEAVPGHGDPVRLDQVLHNLIANGVKYSPQGGAVRVSVRRAGGWAEVVVHDSGIGIPRDVQAQIFEPFTRTDEAKTTTAGAGLGLYIAARIIAGHAGTIAVDSEPGRGSTFTVRLPLVVSADRQGDEPPASAGARAPGDRLREHIYHRPDGTGR